MLIVCWFFRCLRFLFRRSILKHFRILMSNSSIGNFCFLFRNYSSSFHDVSFTDACKTHHFCSLLLRRECCTFSNGEYVKAGLAELELWCCQAKEEVSTLSIRYTDQCIIALCIFMHYLGSV